MESQIQVKSKYNSLEKISEYFKQESSFESSVDYDSWDVRTDTNGQMEKCVLVKKSAMHGIKIYFSKENTLQMNYIIPNKVLNAYFGKNEKAYQNILEIITGKVKEIVLVKSQKQAFEEISQTLNKIKI